MFAITADCETNETNKHYPCEVRGDHWFIDVLTKVTTISEMVYGYHIGVIDTDGVQPSSGGYANGIAFMPGRSFVALGHEELSTYRVTFAHELAHNYGRKHVDCGGPDNVDEHLPYSEPCSIAVPGIEITPSSYASGFTRADLRVAHNPLMGYGGFRWPSPYTFFGVLAERRARDAVSLGGSVSSLVIVGTLDADSNVAEVPYLFFTEAPVRAPSDSRDLLIVGLDADGRMLFRQHAALAELSNSDGTTLGFSTAIPVSEDVMVSLHTLEARDRKQRVVFERTRAPIAVTAQAAAASVIVNGVPGTFSVLQDLPVPQDHPIEVTWPASETSSVLVRDRVTGEVLGIGRAGSLTVAAPSRGIDVIYSDGLRSVTTSWQILPQHDLRER